MLERKGSNKNSHLLLMEVQSGAATLEGSLAASNKTKYILPYDPAIVLFSIYPEEMKTYVHTKTFTWTFTAALLVIAKI